MKSRNGFVSNSSSSSFVLYKEGMTEKQIESIRRWVEEIGAYSGDNDISEGKA
jgi:hypothetical protein